MQLIKFLKTSTFKEIVLTILYIIFSHVFFSQQNYIPAVLFMAITGFLIGNLLTTEMLKKEFRFSYLKDRDTFMEKMIKNYIDTGGWKQNPFYSQIWSQFWDILEKIQSKRSES